MPCGGFGDFNRVTEHLGLTTTQTWEMRVAGCFRIVANPKIDAAVSGEEHRVVRDKAIIQPAWRRAQRDANHERRNGSRPGPPKDKGGGNQRDGNQVV